MCSSTGNFLLLMGLVITALLISAPACQRKVDTLPDDPAHIHVDSQLFLWKIEPGNKKQAGFILGSVHFLKKEFHPLDQTIENTFAQCPVLAVETCMKPADRVTAAMKKGIYKADQPHNLQNQISPKTYERVQKKIKNMGMDIQLFKKFKPWYLAQTISYMEIMARGFQPAHGLDVYFLEKARKDPGKTIIALEKLEEQIDFYDSLPAEVNEAYLLTTLEKTPDNNNSRGLEAVAAAWSRGDTREMERLLHREINKKPGLEMLYEKLIYERNRNMAERICSLLKTGDKSYFFLVGAFHLVGKRGIIQLLKDNGFRLHQL